MHKKNLNFIVAKNPIRRLQASVVLALFGCVAMGSALVLRDGGGTATIADTLVSPSFSELPLASVAVKPKAISEHEVTSAARGLQGDTIRYYESGSGKAFVVTLGSQRTEILSDTRLSGFLFSHWVPLSQKVISAFQKPSGIEYRFYDYETKTATNLRAGITQVTAATDGRKLALLQKNTDDSFSVALSAIDGSDPRTILTTRITEPTLAWRTDTELAITSRRTDRAGYDMSLLSLGGALKPILSNKENLETLWSPDGNYLLYSYFAPDDGVSVWLRSIETGDEVALSVYTSVTKCAWHPHGLAVTCGVPLRKSLSRDTPAHRTATIDDIYTYDFDSSTLNFVYHGDSTALIGVTGPLVSSSGNYFVFTNMFDSRLFVVPLEAN